MGCSSSSPKHVDDSNVPEVYQTAERVSVTLHTIAHARLQKLRDFDQKTKVPFILVELTGEGDGEGEIEICGKNEYGIYEALDSWLLSNWSCERMDAGNLSEDTKIPFCRAQYKWRGFHVGNDEEGLDNMGKATMELVDFVSGKMSWTLAVVNGGNVGRKGETREQQVIFKAPHPMNLVVPHMLIELRSAGYIEVSADLDRKEDQMVLDEMHKFFVKRFKAKLLRGHEKFCDRYYKAGDGVFQAATEGNLDDNLGLLTIEVCDKLVSFPGWNLVSSDSGNYGESSEHCEQRLIFRKDQHPLDTSSYLLATLRSSGTLEVCGQDARGIFGQLRPWLQKKWGGQLVQEFKHQNSVCERYTWKSRDMMTAVAHIVSYFEHKGWEMQVASQGMIKLENGEQSCEQQLLFRPGATEEGVVEPHLVFELYAGEGSEDLYNDPNEPTQVLANQHIKVRPIHDKNSRKIVEDATSAIHDFIIDYLGGIRSDSDVENVLTWKCNVFLCRGRFENNLAQWTMRMCDFMVDNLGWSFIACSLCNRGDCGQYRAQQLVFRFDGDKREVPVSKRRRGSLGNEEFQDDELPSHWTHPDITSKSKLHHIVTCSDAETRALQEMVDATFKRTLTRDRAADDDAPEGEEMPYRLQVVQAFRSEHRPLHQRYEERRREFESTASSGFEVKTHVEYGTLPHIEYPRGRVHDLNAQLGEGDEYLFHGTNPSSAMSILNTGFVLVHSGSNVGTMFGNGIYMAERSSKADEYGKDDGGNTYPQLNALLVCRCLVGTPMVVHSAGDHIPNAVRKSFHCVCGDRESKVGTYREFVFFDERQIYPEYTVIYRRKWHASEVPAPMRTPTTGTTGRYWQIKTADGDWKNVPPELNRLLSQTKANGDQTCEYTLHGTEYTFNVVEKQGTNNRTGNVAMMRAPMSEAAAPPPGASTRGSS